MNKILLDLEGENEVYMYYGNTIRIHNFATLHYSSCIFKNSGLSTLSLNYIERYILMIAKLQNVFFYKIRLSLLPIPALKYIIDEKLYLTMNDECERIFKEALKNKKVPNTLVT